MEAIHTEPQTTAPFTPQIPSKRWARFRRFWWVDVAGLAVLLLVAWSILHFAGKPGQPLVGSGYPACPANLSGVLTYPLMEPKYIAGMIPLGNVNPPGHTSPVDHIYFNVNTDDRVPLYAPADSWITHVMANSVKDANGQYKFDSYVVTYTVCKGLVLDFAGYNDVNQTLKAELAKYKDSCKYGITKVGHDNAGEGQCDYKDLAYKVKAGDQIGWTQRAARPEGGYTIPFEIWAANYNKPARSDVNWETYYGDNRYAHSMCTFDLYAGTLKSQFDALFGMWDQETIKDGSGNVVIGPGKLIRRTAAPVCGTVNQDVVGMLQGMWFSSKLDKNDTSGNVGGTGQGLAFLHNNIDPGVGEVSIGGEFIGNISGVMPFNPRHSGTINREPSEVKAGGGVYCYQGDATSAMNQPADGSVLVQVVDAHHIKAEHQSGPCTTSESFTTPFTFER